MIVHPHLAEERFRKAILPLLESPEILEKAGIRFVNYEFPFLIVALDWRTKDRWIRLHIDATDFDYRALHGWWVDNCDNPLLAGSALVPSGRGFHANSPHLPPCGKNRSWFCFQGWQDYHDHSSYQDIAWPVLRGQSRFTPLALIQQLQFDLNRQGVNAA